MCRCWRRRSAFSFRLPVASCLPASRAAPAMAGACVLPVCADSTDDRGDGRAAVVIPCHVPTSRFRPRTWAFLGIAALLGLVFVGWQRPAIPLAYDGAVRDVAVAITRDPATVNGYVARLHPATLYLAVAYILGISLVV